MKIKIHLKDPDALYESISEALAGETFGLTKESEIEKIRESRQEEYMEIANKWFEYGEYVDLELDTEEETLTILEAD